MSTRTSYHHGNLRAAVIAAAVAEVEAVGADAVSLREIARRAGVSHAAPAHHFGDRAGLFTAIATEGFAMAAEEIAPHALGRDEFIAGGAAYVGFALAHPGHFEVMFRPALYRGDDPDLAAARNAAFDVLWSSARASVEDESDVLGLVLAGWATAHGFATLWLSASLEERLGEAAADAGEELRRGMVTLGRLAERVAEG